MTNEPQPGSGQRPVSLRRLAPAFVARMRIADGRARAFGARWVARAARFRWSRLPRCPHLGLSPGWRLALPLVIAAMAAAAQVPRVLDVEPPGWWPDHAHNPVRLLLTGEHLDGVRLDAPGDFRTGDVRVNENGTHAFVDLHIPPGAVPGAVPLTVRTGGGEAAVPFELFPALEPDGRWQGLSRDDVIYLVMLDRFSNGDPRNDDPPASAGLLDRSKPRHYHGGDIQGVMDRLDYLESLGITTVWITPWYDNANRLNHVEKYTHDNRLSTNGVPSTDYHGYGAVDFYVVEEHFGDLNLLREMIGTAQARGIKVMQDQVANHTGPLHAWTANPPTDTWYNGTVSDHLPNSWQIWTTTASNPPPDLLESTLEGWFLDILPDLNQSDPEVARYLIQNSLWWLGRTGADAIRQDTLPYVPRRYWAQWASAVRAVYPGVTILGEVYDGDPRHVSFFQGGRRAFDGIDTGIHTLFDFPLYYAIRDVFANGQSMTRLTDTLAADSLYADASVLVTFLGLHDTPRFMHEPGATVEGLQLAFTFLLTTRGTPLIYYGDEIAMNGGQDPFNRRDFPGGWEEDPGNAFEAAGRTAEQQSVHGHVAALLNLRKSLEPLRRGDLVSRTVGPDTYVFARNTPGTFTLVALNKSAQRRPVRVSLAGLPGPEVGSLTDRLGRLGRVPVTEGHVELELPPMSGAVLVPGGVLVETRNASGD